MRAEVIHGEALSTLRDMPDASVDAVITDPPYSSGGQFRGDRTQGVQTKYVQTGTFVSRPDFAGDNRDQRSFFAWASLWLSECLRVAKPGSPVAVFSDWRQLPTVTDAVQSGGWVWRGIAVWTKPSCRPAMGRFASQAEYIVWGSAGPMPAREDVGCLPGRFEHSVLQAEKEHVTGKPISLMRNVVGICPPGGIVLDPFCGSGTTGVGAISEGRGFVGIECQLPYVELARRRLSEATAPLFAQGGAA